MSHRLAAFYVAVAGLFVSDRLLKLWFLNNPNAHWDFIVGWLGFSLTKNSGIAFGIPLSSPTVEVVIVTAVLFLVHAWLRARQIRQTLLRFGLSLMIVGAVSNLVDRLRYGAVIDYIDVPFFTVFNLADVMISGGVGLLIIDALRHKRQADDLADTGQMSKPTL